MIRRRVLLGALALLTAVALAPAGGAAAEQATSAGVSWRGMRVPVPQGGGHLEAVACVTATWCMAVGSYGNNGRPLAMLDRSGTWTAVDVPGFDNSYGQLDLTAVSCTSRSFCLAVGNSGLGTGITSSVLAWNGTSWAAVRRLPRSNWDLHDVSCVQSTYCVLTGYVNIDVAHSRPLAVRWDGLRWSRMSTPNDSPGSWGRLGAVDCVSVAHCVAATNYGFLVLPGGTQWRLRRLSSPTRGGYEAARGVHCFTVKFCLASGGNLGYTTPRWWSGSVTGPWKRHRLGPKNGALTSALTCGTTRSCWAIGTLDRYADKLYDQPQYLEHWVRGSGWVRRAAPGTARQQWTAMSCVGRHCVIVGSVQRANSTPNHRYFTPIARQF